MLTKDLEIIFNNPEVESQFEQCKYLFHLKYMDESSNEEYKREIKKLKLMVSERK